MLYSTTGVEDKIMQQVLTPEEVIAAKRLVRQIPTGDSVVDAILRLVRSARPQTAEAARRVNELVAWGPGPRAEPGADVDSVGPRAARRTLRAFGRRRHRFGEAGAAPSHGADVHGAHREHRRRSGDRRASRWLVTHSMSSDLLSRPLALALEGASQNLAGRLPPALLLEARRVAVTVAQGTHGRRRAGPGDTFWQYRNFEPGILSLFADRSAPLGWIEPSLRARTRVGGRPIRSGYGSTCRHPCTFARLCLRPRKLSARWSWGSRWPFFCPTRGKRVGVPGLLDPKARRNSPTAIMEALARSLSSVEGLPNGNIRLAARPKCSFSDFLEPEADLAKLFNKFAVQGVRGHLMQILDPAEESLPLPAAAWSSLTPKAAPGTWPSTPEYFQGGVPAKARRAQGRHRAQRRKGGVGRLSSITQTTRPSRRFSFFICIFWASKKPIAPKASSKARRQGTVCHDDGSFDIPYLHHALDACGAGGVAGHLVASAPDAAQAPDDRLSPDLAPFGAQGARNNADTEPLVALALRMLIAAAVIGALAGPVMKPLRSLRGVGAAAPCRRR